MAILDDTATIGGLSAAQPPISAPTDEPNADLFTDTIKFSLAADLIGQGSDKSEVTSAQASADLFGEEPLFGLETDSIAMPEISRHHDDEVPDTLSPTVGLVTAEGKPFVEEVATVEPAGTPRVADDRVSGDDIAGKIDEMFGSDADISDEEILSDRRLGDTDFFEVKTEADEQFDQTVSWDRSQLQDAMAAAATEAQAAATVEPAKPTPQASDLFTAPAAAAPIDAPLDEMPVSLDALPDDSAETAGSGDFYTVSGDTASDTGAASAAEPVEGLSAMELEITPGTSHNIFLDEDLASDTAMTPIDAEFSDLGELKETAVVEENIASPASAVTDDAAIFLDQATDSRRRHYRLGQRHRRFLHGVGRRCRCSTWRIECCVGGARHG
jgi:hypothetical protein